MYTLFCKRGFCIFRRSGLCWSGWFYVCFSCDYFQRISLYLLCLPFVEFMLWNCAGQVFQVVPYFGPLNLSLHQSIKFFSVHCLSDWIHHPGNSIVSVLSHIQPIIFLYSKNVTFLLYFTSIIYLSFYKRRKILSAVGTVNFLCAIQLCVWFRSFLPHFPHVYHPLQASLLCRNFWHLKHFKAAGIYCSTLLRQYPIFPSLGLSSSSSCRAASKDFPDPLSPSVSIGHRSRQVLQTTFCIGTELL